MKIKDTCINFEFENYNVWTLNLDVTGNILEGPKNIDAIIFKRWLDYLEYFMHHLPQKPKLKLIKGWNRNLRKVFYKKIKQTTIYNNIEQIKKHSKILYKSLL